jgi:F-type H+-transporting ATPase subunit b
VSGLKVARKFGWGLVLGLVLVAPLGVSRAYALQPQSASGTVDQEEHDETVEYKQSKMVQGMAHMLGMSPALAADVFEWLNFAVLAGLLGWAVLKSVPGILKARSAAIEKELTEAKTATEAASLRLSSVEARLAKLDEQIAEMKASAATDWAAEEQRLKAAAEEERLRILASADAEIASAAQAAQRQLAQYAAGLAIDQAAKSLVISAETDRLLVQNFANRMGLGKSDGKGGPN